MLADDVSKNADEWLIDREIAHALEAEDKPIGVKYCVANNALIGIQTIYG